MMWDRKKQLGTILSRRRAGGGPVESGPTEMKNEVVKDADGVIDGRHVAAQDLIAALDSKSADQLMQALANFMDLHNSQPAKPDPREG